MASKKQITSSPETPAQQEALRLSRYEKGRGIISQQELDAKARDKENWNRMIATRDQQIGSNQPIQTGIPAVLDQNADKNALFGPPTASPAASKPQQSARPMTFQDRQQNAMVSAIREAKNAQQMRTTQAGSPMGVPAGYVPENRMGAPGALGAASSTQGVVPIAPQYQVSGKSPFGYSGSPAYKSGSMVRATSAPITDATGRQTGVAGATRSNWQQAVVAAHPEIGQAGSEFNKRYVQAVKAQTGEFDPMQLASDIKQGMAAETSAAKLTGPEGSDRRKFYNKAINANVSPESAGKFADRQLLAQAQLPETQAVRQQRADALTARQAAQQSIPDKVGQYIDKTFSVSPEDSRNFNTAFNAQKSVFGQMGEVIKHPISAVKDVWNTHLNTPTVAEQIKEMDARQAAKKK